MADDTLLTGRGLAEGDAVGPVLHLTEPLNAWGGLDPASGVIVHEQHPQHGACVAGTVLVLLETRGSGTNAQVLAEAWRTGHGPAAVVLGRADSVLMAGVVVSRELYGVRCPVVVLAPDLLPVVGAAGSAHIRVDGRTAHVHLL